MKRRFGGVVPNTAFRLLVPLSLVYGMYVLLHGEYSPGGGFQAGALLAIGVVLARLIMGSETKFNISGRHALILAGVGTFIYALTGYLTLFGGGQFLDYSYLPFKIYEELPEMHALGILMIEVGVTICVMSTIIDIMDIIIDREDIDD